VLNSTAEPKKKHRSTYRNLAQIGSFEEEESRVSEDWKSRGKRSEKKKTPGRGEREMGKLRKRKNGKK